AAVLLGFIGLTVAASLDYRVLQRGVWVIYGGAVLLLALVLSPVGTVVKGAQRWIFGIQPSEFAKLALVLALAWFAARFTHRLRTFSTGILGMGAVALPLLVLIVVEPDKGTTLLLACVTVSLMLVAGVRWTHVLVPIAAGAVAFGLLIANSGYARNRVLAFADRTHNPDLNFQVNKSIDAFAVGGVHGTGLGTGTLKWGIPEVSTDFVFPAVGEELGLPFTLAVVGVFVVILGCGALIAHRAPDIFGMLIATGITFTLAGQALVNMGVVTDLLPNKGMALPFLSRGGTGTVVLLTLVGLLISVARQADRAPEPVIGRAGSNPFGEADTDFPQ
ncbi:MAG: FtsW/RodA/SpoVE family cell cycle protein, partial [Verrucomicrobiae bacterium]|nr:FtsW/RodA/SpoVE family cell cycle protein [Verrucomicrobiae bacterium]